MFREGDAVVHPIRGAGVVEAVEKRRWHGSEALYYRIDLLGQPSSSLMIPVSAAKTIGVRRAIPRSRLKQVWGVLCTDPMTLPTEHKERYQLLEDKLHAGDVLKVAEAVRDMAGRQQSGQLTTRGQRMYQEGLALLAGEIAATQGINMADAEAQVKAQLQQNVQ